MKRILVAMTYLAMSAGAPSWADCTTTVPAHGTNLPQTGTPSVTSVLNPGGNVYACYNPGSGRENNETLLSGGQFQEWHSGASSGAGAPQIEGNWLITGGSSGGIIKYTYTTGATKVYNYYICSDNAGSTYHFVNTATNAVYNIVISSGPGSC